MALRKAVRKEQKLRINMSGVSGSGKTYSALLLAKGLLGGGSALDDVGVLCTENGSADLYCHLGGYACEHMSQPFSPDRYVKAIEYFASEDIKCMIIDSASHEWEGAGGCLEIHASFGGQFSDWAKVTPMHKRFLDAITGAPMHIITTTRRKTDYVVEKNNKGKMAPRKVGLKEVQRDGYEYELTVSFDINIDHFAVSSKDRTSLFESGVPFKISEETGLMLRKWNLGE